MLGNITQLIKNPTELLIFILLLVIPLLFAIILHELAHGYVAYKFGDMTPKLTGRLTLNPIAHIDPLGLILLFVIGLGWAKPVLINLQNIPNKTKQMLVALAGPAMNIFLAIIFALIIAICIKYLNYNNEYVIILLDRFVIINFALALFNLIPIPPLDGSRILAWVLNLPQYNKFEQYGMFVLLLLLFTVGFNWLFNIAQISKQYLYMILGIIQ